MSGRRAWGWHRLDPYWAEQIAASAAIRPGELVIDLGAGTGALTLRLVEAGARVIAVELHAGRAGHLREKVNGRAKVVECDLEDFVAPGRPFRLVANPPYALTSALLAFVARARHLTAADLVLQRAAVRHIVDDGSRGLRRFDARRGLAIPRNAFVPKPPVDSTVLHSARAEGAETRRGRGSRSEHPSQPASDSLFRTVATKIARQQEGGRGQWGR